MATLPQTRVDTDALLPHDTLTVRLIIPRNGNSEVLLTSTANGYILPEVEIPRGQRVAPHVREQTRQKYQIDTLCLFNPRSQPRLSPKSERLYQVLEVVNNPHYPKNAAWVHRIDLPNLQFEARTELELLQTTLDESDQYNCGNLAGPFAKTGWIYELISKMTPILQDRGLKLHGTWSQYNASPTFTLCRFDTSRSAVWFKAVGEPSLHEYQITVSLAERYPLYVPQLLGTWENCHGWLMLEADGAHPGTSNEISAWLSTVSTLANLQLETIHDGDSLLAAGCHDLRIERLLQDIPDFMEMLAVLMERQPVTRPAPLSAKQIAALGRTLLDACHQLEALRVPDTLGHADFNPGNVLVTANRTVFLDWAEAYFGHPVFTLQYLLAHLRQQGAERQSWAHLLRETYSAAWDSKFMRLSDLKTSIALSSFVAIYAYATVMPNWRDKSHWRNFYFAKYMRSLGRRMYQEAAEALVNVEGLCDSLCRNLQ